MSAAWTNRVLALLLFIMATGLVTCSQRSHGIVRDEAIYMSYGSRYANWWVDMVSGEEGLREREAITGVFGGNKATDGNREHPPLMKTLFGLSERLFHDKLDWLGETTGYRLPTALVHGLLVVLVFFFVLGFWGRTAALASSLLVLFLPRAFFHAGLATFDSPVVTFWFASIVAYYRSLQKNWGFVVLGLCAGLALATKHNAILLPAAILPHYVYLVWRERPEGGLVRGLWTSFRGTRGPQILVGLFVIAPAVLIALWPWLWFDTKLHLGEWIGFHLHHVHYNYEYLGKNWNAPPFPWHVPLVTTLLTAPFATLVACLVGSITIVARYRRGERADGPGYPALLLFLSAGVAMGPFFLTSTPIFGAEKHWAAAMPSLCIAAGLGLVWMAQNLIDALQHTRPRWHRALVRWVPQVALLGSVIGAAAVETCHAQPYALSHYNALAGGPRGGADLGMNRQFWGYSARGVLPFINQFASDETSIPVYSHEASMVWQRYFLEGLLVGGMPDSGREEAGIHKSKIAIVVHELHFARHDFMIWREYKKLQPSFVLTYDGVPLVSVYVRDSLLKDLRPARLAAPELSP